MAGSPGTIEKGKVVYWNRIFGFILSESGSTIFFHKNFFLSGKVESINLLDHVIFKWALSNIKKHQNKPIAIEIQKIANYDLSEFDRYIGIIEESSNERGIISPPSSKWKYFFNYARKIYKDEKYKKGDLVIFSPAKISREPDFYFAHFVYSLEREKDLVLLSRLYQQSQLDGVLQHLNKLKENSSEYSEIELFNAELEAIGRIDNPENFQLLLALLDRFKDRSHVRSYDFLKEYCSDAYLIQLWEMGYIEEYDLNLIKKYFHATTADNKRSLALKLDQNDKEDVLYYHFIQLKDEGVLNYITNHLKTLLDIVYRNEATKYLELYERIKTYLLSVLTPSDIIQLWLSNYLGDIEEEYILDNFDLEDETLVYLLFSKDEQKFSRISEILFERYFYEFSKDKFEENFSKLVKYLIWNQKNDKAQFNKIIKWIKNVYTEYQIFLLKIFAVDIEFDAHHYFTNNYEKLNDYYKIKYFIHKDTKSKSENTRTILNRSHITQGGLIEYIHTNPWNSLIQPTQLTPILPLHEGDCYFLKDVSAFISTYNYEETIDITDLAIEIFESAPKFQELHIRLWLYGYVDDEYFNYVGFCENFKNLTPWERKKFKEKGENLYKGHHVEDFELETVIPCTNFEHVENNLKKDLRKYTATIENLYFRGTSFKLRMHDGKYTTYHSSGVKFSLSGLNRIPRNSALNRLPIQIVVENQNEIVSVSGLKEIINRIHTGLIEMALGKVTDSLLHHEMEHLSAYVEDWQLRNDILEYLNNFQVPEREIIPVYEPKNFARRLDEESGVTHKEMTALYTLESAHGYAIVWENIDMTEDKATYIFLSEKEFLDTQLKKIEKNIISKAQLRTTLSSRRTEEELKIFKASLGFSGSIRKQRGKENAFNNWLTKLKAHLNKHIPELPSDEELEKLENWSSKTPTHKRPKPIKRTIEPEVKTFDMDPKHVSGEVPKKDNSTQNYDYMKKEKVLAALDKFNKYFLENLKL